MPIQPFYLSTIVHIQSLRLFHHYIYSTVVPIQPMCLFNHCAYSAIIYILPFFLFNHCAFSTLMHIQPLTLLQCYPYSTIVSIQPLPIFRHPKSRLLVGVGAADTRAKAKLQHEPLHVACLGNCGEVVNFLLTQGNADAEARDKNGMTCLHLAIERNKLESILELTKHG